MAKEKASRTAYKVALNIITLGSKPGMDRILPPGILEATENLLLYSGAVGPKTLKWSKSKRAVSIYEAFDWMLPGQFEAFAHRKAFCEQQVREGIDRGAVQLLILGAGSVWFQFDDQIGTVKGNMMGNWLDVYPTGIYGWAGERHNPIRIILEIGGKHRIRIQPRQTPHRIDQVWLSRLQTRIPDTSEPILHE